MSSEDEQAELCSKCDGKMDSLKFSWPVDLICDHQMCLKCIMADYPQETDEVFCRKCDCLKKIKYELAV